MLIDHGEIGDILALLDVFAAAHRGGGLVELAVDVAGRFRAQPVEGKNLLQVPGFAIIRRVRADRPPLVADGKIARTDTERLGSAHVKLGVLRRLRQFDLKRAFFRQDGQDAALDSRSMPAEKRS